MIRPDNCPACNSLLDRNEFYYAGKSCNNKSCPYDYTNYDSKSTDAATFKINKTTIIIDFVFEEFLIQTKAFYKIYSFKDYGINSTEDLIGKIKLILTFQ